MSSLLSPMMGTQATNTVNPTNKNINKQENDNDSFEQAMSNSVSKKDKDAGDADRPSDKLSARPAKRPLPSDLQDLSEDSVDLKLGMLATAVNISDVKLSADAQLGLAIAAEHSKHAKLTHAGSEQALSKITLGDSSSGSASDRSSNKDAALAMPNVLQVAGKNVTEKNNANTPNTPIAALATRINKDNVASNDSAASTKTMTITDQLDRMMLPKNSADSGQTGQQQQSGASDLSSSVISARDLQTTALKTAEPFSASLSASVMQMMPTPAATLVNAGNANPIATLPVHPEVGSEDWGSAVGEQVLWMGDNELSSAELHLNPPELGPLKVTLSFTENQAQAHFTSAHLSVRAALEAALPQLRAALQDNGITLDQASVSTDTQEQHNAFAQNENGQSSASGQQGRRQTGEKFGNDAVATTEQTQTVVKRSNLGAIDTFV